MRHSICDDELGAQGPVSLLGSAYDLATFSGRFMHFLHVTDPRSLAYSDEEVLEAKRVTDECAKTGMQCGSEQQMKHYQSLVDAGIHPATGQGLVFFALF